MDLISLLPYEILQLVASWLLPRHQCRLALVSKWCYRYLYTDLLRWHAHAAPIRVPRHKIYNDISVLVAPNQHPRIMILKRREIYNLTNNRITKIGRPNYTYAIHVDAIHHGEIYYTFRRYRDFKILDGYHRYVGKALLLLYINMRNPIFSLSNEIKDKIHHDYLTQHEMYMMDSYRFW